MNTSIYDRYTPGLTPPDDGNKASLVFVVNKNSLLIRKKVDIETESEVISIPKLSDLIQMDTHNMEYLGSFDHIHCYSLNFKEGDSVPEGMAFENLRTLYTVLDSSLSMVAGRAMHIANWSRLNQYCGACGGRNENKKDERAKACTVCGNIIYPRISPAIIIAVVNVSEDKLLLAHNKNFPGKRYSVIAGFMEPGETFEDCAKREVFEEVGIQIKNIQFFGSQPWPFPDSLMIGLTAEYDRGEVKPDGIEIDDARWYSREELPEVPGTISIAGRLIEWFVNMV